LRGQNTPRREETAFAKKLLRRTSPLLRLNPALIGAQSRLASCLLAAYQTRTSTVAARFFSHPALTGYMRSRAFAPRAGSGTGKPGTKEEASSVSKFRPA
jgi:hypothetical protein